MCMNCSLDYSFLPALIRNAFYIYIYFFSQFLECILKYIQEMKKILSIYIMTL